MLIDTLSIAYSGNAGSDIVSNPTQLRFINAWANLLAGHGWTQIESLHAMATVTFPLGVPITDGVLVLPLIILPCSPFPGSLAIGTQWFTFYDPFKYQPGFGSCIFVPEDVTFDGSIANLASAINGNTPWICVVVKNSSVSFTLNLTALTGGPDLNFVIVQSSGLTSGQDRSSGGGYRMRSSNLSNSAQFDCACINANSNGAGIDYLGGNIQFIWTINGQNTSTAILDADQGTLGTMGSLGVGGVAQYTVIANPYGFAVFDEPRDVTTHFLRAISVFCMAPYFPAADTVPPTENFVPAYAVFVIAPNQIGGPPSWNNPFMGSSTMCLDGPLFQTYGFNPSARLVAYRSPTNPLLGPNGVMFHYGAYVQFGSMPTNTDPAWVVGKLWDVCIVTDFVDTDAIIDGKGFLTMGYSDGSGNFTVCTVMMCGDQNPVGPSKNGTVNLFGDGVTWLTGDLFTSDMAGGPITIGGTAYIVATFVDSKHLTLTTASTILSGATYSAPDPSTPSTGGSSPLCISAPGASGRGESFGNSGH
jgi:hypothetical protein